eukprot:Awhi_evm2s8982
MKINNTSENLLTCRLSQQPHSTSASLLNCHNKSFHSQHPHHNQINQQQQEHPTPPLHITSPRRLSNQSNSSCSGSGNSSPIETCFRVPLSPDLGSHSRHLNSFDTKKKGKGLTSKKPNESLYESVRLDSIDCDIDQLETVKSNNISKNNNNLSQLRILDTDINSGSGVTHNMEKNKRNGDNSGGSKVSNYSNLNQKNTDLDNDDDGDDDEKGMYSSALSLAQKHSNSNNSNMIGHKSSASATSNSNSILSSSSSFSSKPATNSSKHRRTSSNQSYHETTGGNKRQPPTANLSCSRTPSHPARLLQNHHQPTTSTSTTTTTTSTTSKHQNPSSETNPSTNNIHFSKIPSTNSLMSELSTSSSSSSLPPPPPPVEFSKLHSQGNNTQGKPKPTLPVRPARLLATTTANTTTSTIIPSPPSTKTTSSNVNTSFVSSTTSTQSNVSVPPTVSVSPTSINSTATTLTHQSIQSSPSSYNTNKNPEEHSPDFADVISISSEIEKDHHSHHPLHQQQQTTLSVSLSAPSPAHSSHARKNSLKSVKSIQSIHSLRSIVSTATNHSLMSNYNVKNSPYAATAHKNDANSMDIPTGINGNNIDNNSAAVIAVTNVMSDSNLVTVDITAPSTNNLNSNNNNNNNTHSRGLSITAPPKPQQNALGTLYNNPNTNRQVLSCHISFPDNPSPNMANKDGDLVNLSENNSDNGELHNEFAFLETDLQGEALWYSYGQPLEARDVFDTTLAGLPSRSHSMTSRARTQSRSFQSWARRVKRNSSLNLGSPAATPTPLSLELQKQREKLRQNELDRIAAEAAAAAAQNQQETNEVTGHESANKKSSVISSSSSQHDAGPSTKSRTPSTASSSSATKKFGEEKPNHNIGIIQEKENIGCFTFLTSRWCFGKNSRQRRTRAE